MMIPNFGFEREMNNWFIDNRLENAEDLNKMEKFINENILLINQSNISCVSDLAKKIKAIDPSHKLISKIEEIKSNLLAPNAPTFDHLPREALVCLFTQKNLVGERINLYLTNKLFNELNNDPLVINELLVPFNQIKNFCTEISENLFVNPSYSAVEAFAKIDPQIHELTLELLNEMIYKFEEDHPISQKLKYGQQMTNLISQESSTYFHLCRIRNLLMCGPKIIDDFRKTYFLGGLHHYVSHEGLKAFQYYTGNLINLSTEIDANNDLEALEQAEKMIVQFGERCGVKKTGEGKLTAADVATALPNRKLDLPNRKGNEILKSIPVTFDANDCCNHGLYKAGRRYYVNVPDSSNDSLLFTILMQPYFMAELIYKTKIYNKGAIPKFYKEFFQKGLSNMCLIAQEVNFINFYHAWNAKLEGAKNRVKEAYQKVLKGDFGNVISQKGPDIALKEAQNRFSLINILDKYNFECSKNTSFEEWLTKNEEPVRRVLVENHLWEEVLYRVDEEADFFLLDESTLKLFLKDYHPYLQGLDFD